MNKGFLIFIIPVLVMALVAFWFRAEDYVNLYAGMTLLILEGAAVIYFRNQKKHNTDEPRRKT